MLKQHKTIDVGDLVVVYETFNSMKAAYIEKNSVHGTRFGNFLHKDWIGKPFGSKVTSKDKKGGFVYLLAPTPELWTSVLRHRTQILYLADISLVCSQLELKPGSVVLESGTGSGSLTTSLARSVAPNGKIFTFEFHEQRSAEATQDFVKNGLGDIVSVNHRDIEGQGFPQDLHSKADAIFLDLPKPWLVIESALQCLVPDGRFCSFSPQIEQVQQTCQSLHEAGLRDIKTFECLLRPYEVQKEQIVIDIQKVQQFWDPYKKGSKSKKRPEEEEEANSNCLEQRQYARPILDTRGHTGFLTFARKVIKKSCQVQSRNGNVDMEIQETLS